MADPATMIMAASAATKAVGKLTSGLGEAAASKYNANIADQNAILTAQAAASREDQARRGQRQALGEQLASTLQNSGGALSGSGLDLMRQSQANASLDALNIRNQGDAEVTNFNNQALMSRAQAKSQTIGAVVGAGASLLESAASYAGSGGDLSTMTFGGKAAAGGATAAAGAGADAASADTMATAAATGAQAASDAGVGGASSLMGGMGGALGGLFGGGQTGGLLGGLGELGDFGLLGMMGRKKNPLLYGALGLGLSKLFG